MLIHEQFVSTATNILFNWHFNKFSTFIYIIFLCRLYDFKLRRHIYIRVESVNRKTESSFICNISGFSEVQDRGFCQVREVVELFNREKVKNNSIYFQFIGFISE